MYVHTSIYVTITNLGVSGAMARLDGAWAGRLLHVGLQAIEKLE